MYDSSRYSSFQVPFCFLSPSSTHSAIMHVPSTFYCADKLKNPYVFSIKYTDWVTILIPKFGKRNIKIASQMSHISRLLMPLYPEANLFQHKHLSFNEASFKTFSLTESFIHYECNGESLNADWSCQKIYWQQWSWRLPFRHWSYWLCGTGLYRFRGTNCFDRVESDWQTEKLEFQ